MNGQRELIDHRYITIDDRQYREWFKQEMVPEMSTWWGESWSRDLTPHNPASYPLRSDQDQRLTTEHSAMAVQSLLDSNRYNASLMDNSPHPAEPSIWSDRAVQEACLMRYFVEELAPWVRSIPSTLNSNRTPENVECSSIPAMLVNILPL